jgi:hypothetical protein
MHKIHEVIVTVTLSVRVSMDMLSSSGDIKCYRYQKHQKCKYLPVYINLVYNKGIKILALHRYAAHFLNFLGPFYIFIINQV